MQKNIRKVRNKMFKMLHISIYRLNAEWSNSRERKTKYQCQILQAHTSFTALSKTNTQEGTPFWYHSNSSFIFYVSNFIKHSFIRKCRTFWTNRRYTLFSKNSNLPKNLWSSFWVLPSTKTSRLTHMVFPGVRTRVGFGSGTPGAVVMDNPWFTSLGAGQSSTSGPGRAVLAGG